MLVSGALFLFYGGGFLEEGLNFTVIFPVIKKSFRKFVKKGIIV